MGWGISVGVSEFVVGMADDHVCIFVYSCLFVVSRAYYESIWDLHVIGGKRANVLAVIN